ncbi:hypothetical protein WH50_23130 [Pokkaliibacter plantistimulans]|uniref:Uncharacterized protein n=1 Tax=Pokkaliibacter plantistimulans TaxID=1635171 RepID=A0ABX5LUP3_9GAMM|nr:hypothetical protein WH50_23130 [Pokkaliibacter plantistimulans]
MHQHGAALAQDGRRALTAAAFGTVTHLLPVFCPFLAPAKGAQAAGADFFRQVEFLMGHPSVLRLLTGGLSRLLKNVIEAAETRKKQAKKRSLVS